MRVFLTGATGFVGSHLVDLLLDQGHEIHALVHGESSHQPLVNHERLCPVMGDLLDASKLRNQIVIIEPDLIMHLAGQASPRQSWQKPALTFAINTGGTANVLDAAVAAGRTRTIVVTSAEIYGQINENSLPLTEYTLPDPMHPYGVSKWAAAQLVHLYWMQYGLPVIEARPLNHIGPRQALGFVVPDFASQVAEIMVGEREPLVVVGNLDVARDFTDVRDVVRAYLALAEHGKAGEAYLICSGKAVSIRVILDILLELAGVEVEIKDTVELLRPSDTPQIVGSFAKIHADTGWAPIINLRQSLNDSLKEWEQKWGKVKKGKDRLDKLIVERGLVDSRSRGQTLIMAGEVSVNGETAVKPSMFVPKDAKIELITPMPYVSRGGLKLAAALDNFEISIDDLVCADVGACTGGFTDVLLQRGAKQVFAIDVGYGQLHWKLRQNERVIIMERTNARHLEALQVAVDIATIDVSFISLNLILPRVRSWLNSKADVIALIKPQFEAGKKYVGKGGIVRDPEVHRQVLENVLASAMDNYLTPKGLMPSPIRRGDGNLEFLGWFRPGKQEVDIREKLIKEVIDRTEGN